MKKLICLLFSSFLILSLFSTYSKAQALSFNLNIKEFTLKNGMKFVVMQNHLAPVVSFATIVKAGSVNDPYGKTGLAHLLEHMAFKGTTTVGTKDWKREKRLTKHLDELYARLKLTRSHKTRKEILKKIKNIKHQLDKIIVPNEFSTLIERNGGEDLNAQTSKDYTLYYCSLPSNKVELWFFLESNRLKDPVWREFYTEKKVVLEERKMRVDSNPEGKLFEELLLISYLRHPYRNPGIGWTEDIKNIEKKDLTDFYRRFYNPQNITVCIAGDVNYEHIKDLANKYFAQLPSCMRNFNYTNPYEPVQKGPRSFVIKEKDHTPVYVRAYHGSCAKEKDFVVLDVLSVILGYGRSSLLYKYLVKEKHVASEVYAWNGFPGSIYSSLFIIYVKPVQNVSLDTISKLLNKKIEDFTQKKVKEKDLKRAQKIITVDLLKDMESNLSMAKNLAMFQVVYGDWRKLFYYINSVKKVSIKDITQVLKKYFKINNMIEGRLLN